MTAEVDEITQAALTLDDEDRAALASALLASLDESAEDTHEIEAAWNEEIEDRIDQIVIGGSDTVPWEELKLEISERRARRQP